MNASVAKDTQAALQKHFEKPKLSTKLLSKPPFRFLQDIIIALVNNCQFAEGLYTAKSPPLCSPRQKMALRMVVGA